MDIKRLLPLIYIPELTTKNIEVDSLNFSRAVILLNVSIKNQNVFSIKARNIAYKITIEGHEWIEGVISSLHDWDMNTHDFAGKAPFDFKKGDDQILIGLNSLTFS